MRYFAFRIVGAGLGLVLGVPALADPPFVTVARTVPGRPEGELKVRWLAPFVAVTTHSLGERHFKTVQWFTPDGGVIRELTGENISVNHNYISTHGEEYRIHGVSGDWTFSPPQKPGPGGLMIGTEDGRTLVRQFYPREGEIAADVYRDGTFLGTVGPFLQYRNQDIQLGSDGSLALCAWKGQERKALQIIVVGPDGKERFRVDHEVTDPRILPGPDGNGVLIQTNPGLGFFTFYSKVGRVSSIQVGRHARFLSWLPGSTMALFRTDSGEDHVFHLIDWATGKQLWEVVDPCAVRGSLNLFSVGKVQDYLLICGTEDVGDSKAALSLYAFESRTGRVVASWLSDQVQDSRSSLDGRLFRLEDRLYLLNGGVFAEVKSEDIAGRKNGWK